MAGTEVSELNGPGFLFGPGPAGWWDDAKCSCPVVHREADGYRMWYYGFERGFPGMLAEEMSSIPMGRSGTARSADGVVWEKVAGPGVRGSVLDPSGDPGRFDQFQVGVTEVIRVGDEYRLYFMGTQDGIRQLRGRIRKGSPCAIGLAVSNDGLHFRKVDGPAWGGAVVAPNAPEEWAVHFPRVTQLPDGTFRMYFGVGREDGSGGTQVAESADGIHWERRGQVFGANPDHTAFDSLGAGGGRVIPWQGGWLMAYEGITAAGSGTNFRIGLATSPDGLRWERLPGPGTGGAILDLGMPGSWDEIAIGTPYLVAEPDGSLKLYYVGFSSRIVPGIGLALCDGHDLRRWQKIER
ncbi:MAG: hypothetical protein KatS3mg060_0287 [Dehalococcoidia bacterium]|nr:MAG: hypothetical protein KatS3mg060_0287 [Dehalococcoidia bacterium]